MTTLKFRQSIKAKENYVTELPLHLIQRTLILCWVLISIKCSLCLALVHSKLSKYMFTASVLLYRECLMELQLLHLMYWLDLQDLFFLIKCLLFFYDNFDILCFVSFWTFGSFSGTSWKLFVHFTDCLPLVTFLQEQFRYKTSYHLLNSQDQNYFITKLIADYLLSHFVAFYELSNAPLFIPVQIVLVLSFLY